MKEFSGLSLFVVLLICATHIWPERFLLYWRWSNWSFMVVDFQSICGVNRWNLQSPIIFADVFLCNSFPGSVWYRQRKNRYPIRNSGTSCYYVGGSFHCSHISPPVLSIKGHHLQSWLFWLAIQEWIAPTAIACLLMVPTMTDFRPSSIRALAWPLAHSTGRVGLPLLPLSLDSCKTLLRISATMRRWMFTICSCMIGPQLWYNTLAE